MHFNNFQLFHINNFRLCKTDSYNSPRVANSRKLVRVGKNNSLQKYGCLSLIFGALVKKHWGVENNIWGACAWGDMAWGRSDQHPFISFHMTCQWYLFTYNPLMLIFWLWKPPFHFVSFGNWRLTGGSQWTRH